MTRGLLLALTGSGVVALFVVTYWLYTLAGISSLARVLGRVRQSGIALGVAACLAGAAFWDTPLVVAPLLIGMGLAAYALRNQWIFPHWADVFALATAPMADDALVAVDANGTAIPLSWLAKRRTAQIGDSLIVYCSIARALNAFEIPQNQRIGAILPHATGFYVGNDTQCWDGVDGRDIRGHSNLVTQPISLCTVVLWKARWQGGSLALPPGETTIPPAHQLTPRVPGAKDVNNAMEWGRVSANEWTAFDPANGPSDTSSHYVLSRWAAARRGLNITPDASSESTL